MSPHGCSAVRCRIPDVRNCAREIISFINQRPYVSTSSYLTSHTILHPLTASLLSPSSPLFLYLSPPLNGTSPSAEQSREKWSEFINNTLSVEKYRGVPRRIAPNTLYVFVTGSNPQRRKGRQEKVLQLLYRPWAI